MDVVELATFLKDVLVRSMIHAPYSGLAIFAQKDHDLLWHINEGILKGRFVLCVLAWVFVPQRLRCRWYARAEFLPNTVRLWGERHVNARSICLRPFLADQGTDVCRWAHELYSKSLVLGGRC